MRRIPKDPLTQPRPVGRYRAQFGVIAICRDEADQRATFDRLRALGLECRVVTT